MAKLLCKSLSLKLLAGLLSVSSFGLSANPSASQTYASMPLEELMSLEVFRAASLMPTSITKAPGTVYSFTQDDFVRLGIRQLEDVLQFVPGIQLNQYRKRHSTIWSRGLIDRYNDKLVLLIDGVRIQHLYYGHFSLGDNLPLEKIEKVEVIQGPASSLYGANAFGGIISVNTRGFSDEIEVDATFELADNSRGKGSVFLNRPNFQVFGSYVDQQAPFSDDRLSFIGSPVLQPLDETYRNLFVKTSPFKGLTLTADFQENDTPFVFIPSTQDAYVEERMMTLSASYETGDIDSGRIEASIAYTDDDSRELEYEQVTQTTGYIENQKSETAEAKITGFKRIHPEHILALGASWQHENANDMSYTRNFYFASGFLSPPDTGNLLSDPGVENDDYSLYLQDIWDITSDLTLTLGARYDDFEQFDEHLNYRSALVYSPDERQTWKLLYGTAIRTPSFREYLKVLQGTPFVAPVPDPERIKSLELGYSRQLDNTNFNVTLFNNLVEDYIHEVPTPDGADEYFTNSSDDWKMRGVEMLLRHQINEKLEVRFSGAYLDAEDEQTGDLPYLAEWTGSTSFDYRFHDKHRMGMSFIYNTGRTDTNTATDDNPEDFILTNIFVSGDLTKDASYRFGIDNLFDKEVYDPAGDFGGQYNTEKTEREIWLQLRWSPDL